MNVFNVNQQSNGVCNRHYHPWRRNLRWKVTVAERINGLLMDVYLAMLALEQVEVFSYAYVRHPRGSMNKAS